MTSSQVHTDTLEYGSDIVTVRSGFVDSLLCQIL